MLGLSSFLTASTAVQSAIGRLLGALGGRSTYTENRKDSRDTIIDISKGDILDKASILLTPTSYSDGRMHSVKSASSEEIDILSGTAATSVHWDNATRDSVDFIGVGGGSSGTSYYNTVAMGLTTGGKYLLSFTMSNYSGSGSWGFSTTGGPSASARLSGNGSYSEIFVATGPDLRLFGTAGTNSGTLSNVSVTDISSDFTFSRDSSAMRVGPDGLLQDMQDVVGESELILNGDFSDTVSRIENGDFLDYTEGSEQFGIAIADWKQNENTTGEVTYTKTAEGVKFVIDTAPVNNWDVRLYSGVGDFPLAMTDGKSYRVRYSVKGYNTSGTFHAHMSWLNGTKHNVTTPPGINDTTWTDVDEYIVASNVSGSSSGEGQYLQFWSADADVGDWMEVKDVSVEELDPNDRWADYSTPTGQTSITENGLRITTVNVATTTDHRSKNTGHTLVTGKTYRLEYTVSGFSDPDDDIVLFSLWDGDSYGVALETTLGTHVTYFKTATVSTTTVIFNLIAAADNGEATDYIELSNISLKDITLADDLDIPRISYDKDGLNGHILLEPARTNQIKRSEDFRASPWGSTGSPTISAPSEAGTLAPDGTYTATKFTSASATSAQYAYHSALIVEDVDSEGTTYYTTSVFAKKIDYDYMYLWFTAADSAFVAGGAWFNISNGTLGTLSSGVTASIEDFGNGWYRCSATKLPVDDYDSNGGQIRVALANADDTQNVVGDGSKATYFWGAQFEESDFPSSYIPTHTGASVTRSEETMTGSGNTSLIDSTEGTLYIEVTSIFGEPITSNWKAIAISDGTNNNRAWIALGTDGKFTVGTRKGGEDDVLPNLSLSSSSAYTSAQLSTFKKVAFRYKDDDWAWYVDGDQIATDTSTDPLWSADTFSEINFDSGGGGSAWKGKIKCLAYFDEILTDDELEALTGDSYNNFGELATANGYTVQ